MATVDLYRKCPVPNCYHGTISEYEQGPNATHTSTCRTCNGVGFVRVDAPAPTDALRSAAQDISAEYEPWRNDGRQHAGRMLGIPESMLIALRAALDVVPAPVALTEAELHSLADAVFAATNDEMSVSFVLAKLREVRPELDWLVAK